MIIYELRQPRKVCTSPFAVWPGSRTSCFITLQTSSYFNVSIFPIIIIIIYFSLSLSTELFFKFSNIYIYILFLKNDLRDSRSSLPFQEFSFFHLHRLIIVLNEEKNVIRLPLNFIFLRGQQNPLFLPSIEFIESWIYRENEFFSEKIYIHLDLGNLDKRSNPILSKNQPNIKILIILLPPPPPPPLFVATKKIKQNEPLSVPHYLSNPSTPRGRRIRGVEAR